MVLCILGIAAQKPLWQTCILQMPLVFALSRNASRAAEHCCASVWRYSKAFGLLVLHKLFCEKILQAHRVLQRVCQPATFALDGFAETVLHGQHVQAFKNGNQR